VITEIEKLAEIMKRLKVIPETGYGMTVIIWKDGKPASIDIQTKHLIHDNTFIVNKNGFDLATKF
jgi:hypothetical protein